MAPLDGLTPKQRRKCDGDEEYARAHYERCCGKGRYIDRDAMCEKVKPWEDHDLRTLLRVMETELELAVPGTYRADREVVAIRSFAPSIKVMNSKQRPTTSARRSPTVNRSISPSAPRCGRPAVRGGR